MAFLAARGYLLIFPLMLGVALPSACSQTPDEYQVKAAFVFNFAKFVEWPPHAFKTPSEPFTICILGDDPFGGALQSTVKGKVVDNRPFVIREIPDLGHEDSCHILFVAATERKRFLARSDNTRTAALLTIGEAHWFIPDGGVINFRLEGGKVRFEINPDAAEQEQLRVSSKLLNLAEIVRR